MIRPLRLGLALGVTWALTIFITTLFAIGINYGVAFLHVIESIYPGYEITVLGSIIGLIYGLVNGLIAGLVIGWFYNLFCGKE